MAIANCDFTVSGSAGLALRSSVIETTGNRMQMTHSKASKAMPDLRAPARVTQGLDQKSSRVAAMPAQTILRMSSKVGLLGQGYANKIIPGNVTNVTT